MKGNTSKDALKYALHAKAVVGFWVNVFVLFGLLFPFCYCVNLVVSVWHAMRLENHRDSGDLHDDVFICLRELKRQHSELTRGQEQ